MGASGLTNGVTPSAATACRARNPSDCSRPASATEPKPPPISQRNSRRVRPQKEPAARRSGLERSSLGPCQSVLPRASIEIKKRVGIEDHQAVLRQGLLQGRAPLRMPRLLRNATSRSQLARVGLLERSSTSKPVEPGSRGSPAPRGAAARQTGPPARWRTPHSKGPAPGWARSSCSAPGNSDRCRRRHGSPGSGPAATASRGRKTLRRADSRAVDTGHP